MLAHVAAVSLLLSTAFASLRPQPITKRQSGSGPNYPAYYLSVPVDHFHNESQYAPHSNSKFNLRYYFDATYYKPGGPVIVLQGGETSAESRLPYLATGIVAELANATGGMGVVLEHRYYGDSFPTPDLSTENLRFLTTDQAMADQAYFAQNIVFPGFEHLNLTAPGTPYFAYGGSYAGAFVAFLRTLYPDTYWGAISSSGVTEAYYDYWQYYEPVRQYAPQDCIDTHTKLVNIADQIFESRDHSNIKSLKSAFGAPNITHGSDFMNQYASAMGYWQERNWDPAVNDPTFYEYCAEITSSSLSGNNSGQTSQVRSLIRSTSWASQSNKLTTAMLNLITWFGANVLSECSAGQTQDECFGFHNASAPMYADKSLSNYNSLSWPYQYCNQWGFYQSGSTVPSNELPLISRLITLPWNELVCKYAFGIQGRSDTASIDKYGGYTISYPRLAIIGGQADPWRPVTPLADQPLPDSHSTTDRKLEGGSTVSEPLIIMDGAVHHWDENGVPPSQVNATFPPPPIQKGKAQLIAAAKSWMDQWHDQHGSKGSA